MVGVNTAVAGVGLGLAVPINRATRDIIATLTRTGRVRRAWLGIVGAKVQLAPELAARIGSPTGLQVAGVAPDSPAELAGVHRGDIVVSLDGNERRDVDVDPAAHGRGRDRPAGRDDGLAKRGARRRLRRAA